MGGIRWAAIALAFGIAACGDGSKPSVETPGGGDGDGGDGGGGGGGGGGGDGGGGTVPFVPKPPAVLGDYSFYGPEQGLSATIWDVSADEGGNVYVAGGEALFAKRRDDQDFRKFDAASAGLTANCHGEGYIAEPSPPDAAVMCPIVSVGGMGAGRAAIGFRGVGTDGDFPHNADWAIESGGADLVLFDGEKLSRERHVTVAGWPLQFCDDYGVPGQTRGPCAGDRTWTHGRRKVRQVLRIAVNHRKGTLHHGDVWFAGTHGTFSALVANASGRGLLDLSARYPEMEDRRGVWEHDHPAISDRTGKFLTGESTAIAIDPLTGDPWAANQFRLAGKVGYAWRADGGEERRGWDVPMWPPYIGTDLVHSFFDVWKDPVYEDFWRDYDAFDLGWMDNTSSLSFCSDGSLWVASATKGLARLSVDRAAIRADPNVAPDLAVSVQHVSLPAGFGNSAWAVACDVDGSVWVGFGWGGFGRLRSGSWEVPFGTSGASLPKHALNPVRNIQIDRWSSPRRVYFAHAPSLAYGPGGVTVYSGP
jgi:hypothetical protein